MGLVVYRSGLERSGVMSELRGKKLGRIFVALGVLDADQETAALEYSGTWGVPFGRACVKMGLLDEQTVVQALSMQLGLPSVTLGSVEVRPDVVAMIPAELAETHRLVPLAVVGGGKGALLVAMASPKNLAIVDELAFRAGRRISPVLAPDSEIDAALLKYYGLDVNRHTRSSTMVELDEHPENSALELADVVVHDRLRLAEDFLPNVVIDK
jgi:type IV pilus assembly protein PilB